MSTAASKAQKEKEFVMPGQMGKLDAPKRPGFTRRWVINKPGNIESYQSYGYTFASEDLFQPVKDVSEGGALDTRVSMPAGNGFLFYLMEVTNRRHKEIKQYKKHLNDDIIKTIGIPLSPNTYAPKVDGREQLGVTEDEN